MKLYISVFCNLILQVELLAKLKHPNSAILINLLLSLQENGLEFEASVVAQCDALVNLIEHRKGELITAIAKEVSSKSQKVKQEMADCDKKLKNMMSLSQYANEALKETDPASFMLVSARELQLGMFYLFAGSCWLHITNICFLKLLNSHFLLLTI